MSPNVPLKVRNALMTIGIRDEEWALWLDADLMDYPANLLQE